MSIPKVDGGTIARTIILILTLVNTLLAVLGEEKIPVTENEVYEVVSAILAVAVPLWTWWKNNAFTRNARKAERYRKALDNDE